VRILDVKLLIDGNDEFSHRNRAQPPTLNKTPVLMINDENDLRKYTIGLNGGKFFKPFFFGDMTMSFLIRNVQ
jgi:hypothetical protein